MKTIKKLFSWIKSTFGLGMGLVRNHSFLAVEATELLKKAVRSPYTRVAISLIPGHWAEPVRKFAERIILPILAETTFMAGLIRENQKDSVAIELIIDRLRTLHPDQEAKVYQEFAARMNYRLADGVFSLQECWESAQDIWHSFFKNK